MPQHTPLTPEEFQTVYQRAIKQAPADLSQPEFDDYVHQQAQQEEAAKAGSVAPQAAGGLSFSPSGILGGFLKGAGGVAKGLGELVTTNPLTSLTNAGKAQWNQFSKAADDYGQGRYSEMIGHGVAGALPLMGPAAADLGERTAESGDVGNALGEGSLMALLASPSAMKPALAKAATGVPVAGRGLSALGRGVEAAGQRAGGGGLGHAGEIGGAIALSHGNPMGLAMMAGPKVAEYAGRGLQRMGDSMASLTGDPSEWISRGSSTPSHAELRAGGQRRYDAGRAQRDAAERASGVPENLRDVSPSIDWNTHRTPPRRSAPMDEAGADLGGYAGPERRTSGQDARAAWDDRQHATMLARLGGRGGETTPSMESLMGAIPESWQQFVRPEEAPVMARTGRR